MTMIVAGKLFVPQGREDDYILAHKSMVERALSRPGCLEFFLSKDPVVRGRINLFEHWQSPADFHAWKAETQPPQIDIDILDAEVAHQVIEDPRVAAD
jgi:quinol monooxygenase YgiN